jgi:hypothetical protein
MTCRVGPRLFALTTLLIAIAAPPTHAAGHDLTADFKKLHVTFHPAAERPESPIGPIDFLSGAEVSTAPIVQAPAVAFEYSDAYHRRATIHRIGSIAMIPLFVTQGFLGKEIYEDATSGKRKAHQVVAGAIGGLFAVNTITGVWNLVEGRKDPNKRRLRVTHGLLMLSADALFLATALQAPNTEGTEGSRTNHRALAITSISVATTGYLIMLFGNR